MQKAIVDPTERELGILTYQSPALTGFTAVLKARYSDFVVHEVGIDGRIAKLESVEPKASNGVVKEEKSRPEEPEIKKRKLNDDGSPNWGELESELREFVGEQGATETIELLQRANPSEEKMFVKLPPCAEKETRRNLHEWIRSRLNFCARADTIDETNSDGNAVTRGLIRIWHKSFERKMPNYGKFERNQQNRMPREKAPSDKQYLQFVLYKENMDTGAAVGQIQQFVQPPGGGRGRGRGGRGSFKHGGPKLRMGYAGMKDKRGITSQYITVPASTSLHALAGLNRPGQGGGHTRNGGVGIIRVGNFEYVANELRLGRLKGNRFDIALRNIELGSETKNIGSSLESAAQALKDNGFINYFGVQRFGKYHDTHLTGIAILKGDYEGAIDIIMSPKPDERPNIAEARAMWKDRFSHNSDRASAEKECAQKLSRQFNRFMHSEMAIVNSLARDPLNYEKAFSCINKTMRMMFIHAVQSYLWNHVVSNRIETFGGKVLEGDLVLADPNSIDGEGIPEILVVSGEDISANKYTLTDVVVPLIGSKTRDPANASADLFDTILLDKGLTREMMVKMEDRDFNSAGDYRKMICRPADVDFQVLEYTDPHQPLLQTDLMMLDGIEIKASLTSEKASATALLAMIIRFTLPPSAYATIALRELMKRPTSSEYQSELNVGSSKEIAAEN
jgi:tRNA pseudouridine13 synthase